MTLGRLLLTWAIGLSVIATYGCGALRRFLVPPPQVEDKAIASQSTDHKADLLLHVGRVAAGPAQPTTLALRVGQVLSLGSEQQAQPWIGPMTRVVHLPTSFATPGWADADVDLTQAALAADAVDLSSATTPSQVLTAIANFCPEVNRGEWLWGKGLAQDVAGRLSPEALDRACPRAPLFITSDGLRSGLVNTVLLARLPTELGLQIQRFHGPIDENSTQTVWRALPAPRVERFKPLLLDVLTTLQQTGITEIDDIDGSGDLRDALVDLERDGRLPVRVQLYLRAQDPEALALLHPPPQPSLRPGESPPPPPQWQVGRLLQVRGISLQMDGSVLSHTAALEQPYADTATTGELLWTDEQLQQTISAVDRGHWQLAVSAHGDRALAQLARVLAGLKRPSDAQAVRIVGAQVVSPAVLTALQGQSVAWSLVPWIHKDSEVLSRLLGPTRMPWLNRVASLTPAGPVHMGSGWPQGPLVPLATLATLDGRRTGLAPPERLAPEMALRAMLSGGTGAVLLPETGSATDWVLWSRDPQTPGTDADVMATVIDGVLTVLSLDGRVQTDP